MGSCDESLQSMRLEPHGGWTATNHFFDIDYLLLSHASPAIVTDYATKIYGICGSKDPLSVTRGKKHEFIVMSIDFLLKRGFGISQYEFIKKIYLEVPETLRKKYRNTSALKDLFQIDTDVPLVDSKSKDVFHKTNVNCFE